METVLITGGTGLIGTPLAELLAAQGYQVIILTRNPRKPAKEGVRYASWNADKGEIDAQAVAAADHIIHLAGANVGDKRWTDNRKKEIADSRTKSSALLVRALTDTPNRVKTVVSASAIGWYGPDRQGIPRAFVESDPPYSDFLGETCRLWEDSIRPVTRLGKRLVILRTPIVLSTRGGAFPQLTQTLRLGVASILGSGKQVISWIHIDDMCRLFLHALQNSAMEGPYNASAPEHITNKELVLRAARARKRPYIAVHVPRFALKLALGEMSVEVLKSTTVDDARVRDAGFRFIFPAADAALNQLMG